MAYIAQRGEYWRAEVRRRGIKPVYRTFDTKQQAQQWARRVESEIDCGAYVDRTAAERTTLRDALLRYQRDVVPAKRYPKQERQPISRWLEHELAHRTLANLRGVDFAKYRDARRDAGRAENTIRLELQLVSVTADLNLTHFSTNWGCGRKLGLPGGSSCTRTKTAFERFSFTSNTAEAPRRPFASWDILHARTWRDGTVRSLRLATCRRPIAAPSQGTQPNRKRSRSSII